LKYFHTKQSSSVGDLQPFSLAVAGEAAKLCPRSNTKRIKGNYYLSFTIAEKWGKGREIFVPHNGKERKLTSEGLN